MSELAKVVKVIDPYRVVINRGTASGVRKGDRYLVYELGEELLDPDTAESLGRVEVVRGRGEVTHVQERLATLSSLERTRVTRKSPWSGTFGTSDIVQEEDPFEDPQVGDLARPYTSIGASIARATSGLSE